jgi:hypothetical protein
MRQLMLIIVFMVPAIAQAGPWCLTVDEVMGCSYESSDECYFAAGQRGGNCMPNPREAGVTGARAWCVVTSNMRRCTYVYQPPCARVAQELNGGCVPNTDKLIEKTQNFNTYFGFGSKDEYDVTLANGCAGDLACEAALSGGQE